MIELAALCSVVCSAIGLLFAAYAVAALPLRGHRSPRTQDARTQNDARTAKAQVTA